MLCGEHFELVLVEPRHVHLVATKHVLRYFKGTVGYGLRYVSNCEIRL